MNSKLFFQLNTPCRTHTPLNWCYWFSVDLVISDRARCIVLWACTCVHDDHQHTDNKISVVSNNWVEITLFSSLIFVQFLSTESYHLTLKHIPALGNSTHCSYLQSWPSASLPYTSYFRPATDGPIQVICFPSGSGLPSYVTDGKYWKMRSRLNSLIFSQVWHSTETSREGFFCSGRLL